MYFILGWEIGNHWHMIAKQLVKHKDGDHVPNEDIELEKLVRKIQ